jgi:hypothetical protein
MRELLETFRLPGEAQQIARITETFASIYFAAGPGTIVCVGYYLPLSDVLVSSFSRDQERGCCLCPCILCHHVKHGFTQPTNPSASNLNRSLIHLLALSSTETNVHRGLHEEFKRCQ